MWKLNSFIVGGFYGIGPGHISTNHISTTLLVRKVFVPMTKVIWISSLREVFGCVRVNCDDET